MTPEQRQAIRLASMAACPHWKSGHILRRPCRECEVEAAVALEREACAQWFIDDEWDHADRIAAAIRARA